MATEMETEKVKDSAETQPPARRQEQEAAAGKDRRQKAEGSRRLWELATVKGGTRRAGASPPS
jgi:hypothetical protein